MNDIKRNPEQPREHFDTDKLKELGESIKEVGLINPITVEKQGSKYEIIAGERRYRGSKEVKNKKIIALVKEYKSSGDKAVESLIENVHREDLQPLEKAKFLIKIRKLEGLKTDKELGKRVGMGGSIVAQYLAILPIKDEIKKTASSKKSVTDLSRIASIKDKKIRKKMFDKSKEITQEQLRKTITAIKKAPKPLKEAILKDEVSIDVAEELKEVKEKHIQPILNKVKKAKAMNVSDDGQKLIIEQEKVRMDTTTEIEPFKPKEINREEVINKLLSFFVKGRAFITTGKLLERYFTKKENVDLFSYSQKRKILKNIKIDLEDIEKYSVILKKCKRLIE